MSGKILIVDDQLLLREGLARLLGRDFAVKAVKSGEEALVEISSCKYDLCFLGTRLPGIGGLEVMKRMREISPNTKIAIMSAQAGGDSMIKESECGAFAFVEKPFDIIHIRHIAERALERPGGLQEPSVGSSGLLSCHWAISAS